MAKPKQITFDELPTAPATKPGALIIDTPETKLMVDQLAQAKEMAELSEADIKKLRGMLDPLVIDERNKDEKAGGFTKHVQVKGTGANACYTFADRYAAIDPSSTVELTKLLGPLFPKLFKAGKKISIKKDAIEKLVKLLEGLGLVGEMLEIENFLQPVEGFREARMEARGELTAAQNRKLDEVVKQVQYQPAMTFKG